MEAYIYAADIYCEQCGERLRDQIDASRLACGEAPLRDEPEDCYDSDEYPKGPYCDGGGESDCPQHCAAGADCLNRIVLSDGTAVGCWLENPLTTTGAAYVQEYIDSDPKKTNEVTQLWADWYSEELSQLPVNAPVTIVQADSTDSTEVVTTRQWAYELVAQGMIRHVAERLYETCPGVRLDTVSIFLTLAH